MKYLVSTTEVYRVDTENEATQMIALAKEESSFELAKYSCIKKEKKSKGEVIDEWYQLSLVKKFNDEKDPSTDTVVSYEVN